MATKHIGGGVSYDGGSGTKGRCPRIASVSPDVDFEDSPFASVEVVIPTASVLALRATPYELVPAPGAGKVLQFISAHFQLIYNSIGYTESGCNLGIKYTDGSGVQVNETVEATGFIDQTATTFTQARPKLDPIVAGSGAVNKALVLHNLGGGEIAAGNSALKVKVLYAVQAGA